MDEVKKMLRAIINGQSALKQDLIKRIDGVEKSLGNRIDRVERNLNKKIEASTKRLDKIGKSVAHLEDDTPTREEFDKLEETVEKVVTKTASL